MEDSDKQWSGGESKEEIFLDGVMEMFVVFFVSAEKRKN